MPKRYFRLRQANFELIFSILMCA